MKKFRKFLSITLIVGLVVLLVSLIQKLVSIEQWILDDTGLKKGSKSLPIDREVAYMDRTPFRHFSLDFRFCGSVVFGRQQRGARGKAQSLNRGAGAVQ